MEKTAAARRPCPIGSQLLLGVIRLYDNERRQVALVGFRGGDPEQALQTALDAYRNELAVGEQPTGLRFGLAELLAVDNFDDLLSRADRNLLDGRRRGSARDWTARI